MRKMLAPLEPTFEYVGRKVNWKLYLNFVSLQFAFQR